MNVLVDKLEGMLIVRVNEMTALYSMYSILIVFFKQKTAYEM